MNEEEAKTVQEASRMASKALDTGQKLGKFLNDVAGEGLKELGGAFADWARYVREKNLLSIHDKLEAIYKRRNIEGKTNPISSRYAIPIIQNASQEDNDLLQNLWAGLMANSTDPNKSIDPKKIYIDILSSLEPLDAKILKFFSSQGWKMIPGPHSDGFNLKKLTSNLNEPEKEIQLSLQNLARLGCIIDSYNSTWDSNESTSFGARVSDPGTTFRPTPLGFGLLEICSDE